MAAERELKRLKAAESVTPEEKERKLEEARQRFLESWREILPAEDRKAIAEAVRRAHREDFPEDFDQRA